MSETSSSGPSITRDEIAHLANLARIDLTDAELDHLAPQLSVILESVASIQGVASADVPPTSHALPLTNVFREDVVVASLTAEQALSGAPQVVPFTVNEVGSGLDEPELLPWKPKVALEPDAIVAL